MVPQWQWVEKNPNVESDYAKMQYRVWIMRNKTVAARINTAGGTPPSFDDYITGKTNEGIDAEIREPSAEEVALGGMKGVERLTHTIKIRYDPRVKIGMQIRYYDQEDVAHYCIINTVTNVNFSSVWMVLGCTEEVRP